MESEDPKLSEEAIQLPIEQPPSLSERLLIPTLLAVPPKLLGADPLTGRPKIAGEVLEDMRIYIITTDGPERLARKERVKSSLRDLQDDVLGQKAFLSLQPLPVVSDDLDKGKGIVFDFSAKSDKTTPGEKLMAGAIAVDVEFSASGGAKGGLRRMRHSFGWRSLGRLGGGAWVLRDEKCKVILHGRRAFSEIGSEEP
ncbi:hypothetical protein F2Q68_00026665 [Brassica cretica]|uniref:Uncharacterized protein n=1 Tax=Brassica cretica TaxID=69181 RepID=A0A8S9I9T2_BRACR|nr:hypothetical protein F2Q68_00026665 [Brassica cretica]